MIIEFNLLVILLVQMPLNFYMLYRLCYLSFYFLECFLNLFRKCGVFKNAKWLRKIKRVFYSCLFVYK
ncbi:MAG: hypothetical protein EHU54_04035 [Spiroplasma sp. ald]